MSSLFSIPSRDILTELEQRFFHIPFENSAFQDRTFVIAAQQTPARAYRAIGLRMFAKLRAIDELKYARQRENIDIEELEAKIANPDTSCFDLRRAKIDIEQKLSQRKWADKLLNDAIAELDVLYAELQKYPAYTRETFEAEEAQHFERRLALQIQSNGNGSVESLLTLRNTDQYDTLVANTARVLNHNPPTDD